MSEQQHHQAKFRSILNVYSFTCELPGTGEEVEFKPLTTGQLKRLLTYENEKNPAIQENAIDEIINSAIITKGMSSQKMFLEDRFFFLIQVRKKSKGEVIEFTNDCEECKSQSLIRMSLDDLPIIKRKEEEVYDLDLNDGIKIKLKHITRGEQRQINPRAFKGLSETQMHAEMQLYTNALGIESVTTPDFGEETELTIEDRKFLIENIPTNEYQKILDWYEQNFFGIKFETQFSCIHCRHTEKINIPMEQAFFF
jgi:hypothetical protein